MPRTLEYLRARLDEHRRLAESYARLIALLDRSGNLEEGPDPAVRRDARENATAAAARSRDHERDVPALRE